MDCPRAGSGACGVAWVESAGFVAGFCAEVDSAWVDSAEGDSMGVDCGVASLASKRAEKSPSVRMKFFINVILGG